MFKKMEVMSRMPFQLITLVAVLVAVATTTAAAQALPGCDNHCGDVKVPYPFGTRAGCYLSTDFFIHCSSSSAFPWRSNIRVTNITLDGQLHVMSLVARKCFEDGKPSAGNLRTRFVSLPDFDISNSKNKFTVIGCDSYAYIKGFIGKEIYKVGCMSFCNSSDYVKNGSCIGTGCCQIEIPKGLAQIELRAYSFDYHTYVSSFNPCTYAFVVEQSKFNFYSSYLREVPERFPMVLDWAITKNGTCENEANNSSSSVCGENALCYYKDENDKTNSGYLCKCKDGYEGNAYHPDGCKDIDECDRKLHNCKYHHCVNTEGSYKCNCRKGYHGDGGKDGQVCTPNLFPVVKVVLGVGIFFVVVLVGSSWLYLVLKKRNLIRLKEKFFQQNGGYLLQQQLSKRSGSSDTAKIFTAGELKIATNNYADDRIIGRGGYGTVFLGFLSDNKAVAIKKSRIVDQSQIEQFINEVVVLSQINHRNVVRLLGCCLETEVPLLVYEFVSNGTLYEHIHNKEKSPTISWEVRLRIAAETAEVLSYLHSAASTPIIHRDIKSTNILLDDNYTAKVSDFGASKLVPIDETQLSTMVQGTLGYLDPEYLHTSQLTEKSDVYSFGVVLVELLTGMKALLFDRPEEERSLVKYFLSSLKENALFEILENHILRDGDREQLKEVAGLAAMCLRVKGEERPPMREVAMELQGMRTMHIHFWENNAELNKEAETVHLLSETSDAGYDSIKDHVQLVVLDDGR